VTDPVLLRTERGTVTVSSAALSRLVTQAAEAVHGARVRRPRRGLEIAVEEGRGRVTLELAVRYGEVLPEVARDVQARVAEALRVACEVEVEAVDVAVEELEE
jgi:uncharacterized alkaline shock family protein YloU